MTTKEKNTHPRSTQRHSANWRGRTTLSIEEAAKVLGISRAPAYQLAKSGGLPVLELGRRKVIPVIRLQRMLAG